MADRRTNKLAPEPVNSLTSDGVYYNPSDLYHWLRQQESLPSWVQKMPESSASGAYAPKKHEITALPVYKNEYGYTPRPKELAHEMTHAAQMVLENAARNLFDRRANGEALNPKELQFIDAYRTMLWSLPYSKPEHRERIDVWFSNRENALRQTNALASQATKKDWRENPEYATYRTAPHELQAWGVGGSVQAPDIFGGVENNMQGHLNPTFATEFEMLRGLYDQLPEATRKAARITPRPSPGAVTDYLNPFVK